MVEKIERNIIFRKNVEFIISLQAQKVIASSKYSIEDFENWILKVQKVSLGGNDATLFLEYMYNKEVDNDPTSN